jgi:hypothetical protein
VRYRFPGPHGQRGRLQEGQKENRFPSYEEEKAVEELG